MFLAGANRMMGGRGTNHLRQLEWELAGMA